MKVKLSELQHICEILLKKAEESGFNQIEMDFDNYWLISSDEREKFGSNTPTMCVGSIYDDIDSLKKILNGINAPSPVDFDRLANILIAVGQRISNSNKIY